MSLLKLHATLEWLSDWGAGPETLQVIWEEWGLRGVNSRLPDVINGVDVTDTTTVDQLDAVIAAISEAVPALAGQDWTR